MCECRQVLGTGPGTLRRTSSTHVRMSTSPLSLNHPHYRLPIHYPCSPQLPSAMFFKYNTALGPPYRILLDTNFINFSIKNKLDIVNAGA